MQNHITARIEVPLRSIPACLPSCEAAVFTSADRIACWQTSSKVAVSKTGLPNRGPFRPLYEFTVAVPTAERARPPGRQRIGDLTCVSRVYLGKTGTIPAEKRVECPKGQFRGKIFGPDVEIRRW